MSDAMEPPGEGGEYWAGVLDVQRMVEVVDGVAIFTFTAPGAEVAIKYTDPVAAEVLAAIFPDLLAEASEDVKAGDFEPIENEVSIEGLELE